MIFRSIKWRLQLWYGVILLLVLGGFGYTAFELQRMREFRRTDAELHDRMALLIGPPGRPGRPPGLRGPPRESPWSEGEPPGPARRPDRAGPNLDEVFSEGGLFYYGIWDFEDNLLRSGNLPEMRKRGPSSRSRRGIIHLANFHELRQITPRGETVVVGRSMKAEYQELTNLALFLILSGGGILVVGLTGGWVVATRAMRPINEISGTAQKIATGDLTQRIPHDDNGTELGRLVATLNSTFSRLESAFTEQVRFTTDVSHELRTPVTVIVSQTQMALSRDRSASEYREALAACQRAAQRMRRLIESLLQLARLDAGQETMRLAGFDLAALARENAELLRPLSEERKLRIQLDLQPSRALGDSDQIARVIANLLSNAIQYTPEGGMITVSSKIENGLALLSVADTGIGIPPEDLPNLFNRFYRVDSSRSRDKGGSGLGLAIARAIVHAHGGTLEASSEIGKSTKFTMRLPVAPGGSAR